MEFTEKRFWMEKMNIEYYFFWYIDIDYKNFLKMISNKKFDDIVQKPRDIVIELMFHLKLLITQFGTDI